AGRSLQEHRRDPEPGRFDHGRGRRPRHPGRYPPGRRRVHGRDRVHPPARRRQVRQGFGRRLRLLGRPARGRRLGHQCAVEAPRDRGVAQGRPGQRPAQAGVRRRR
ncbi:hypothetical protein LTR94_035630, partial [Friedmanniomyces endolithicus]